MVEQGLKYWFLILILKKKYRWVIGNERLELEMPEDLGGYNESI